MSAFGVIVFASAVSATTVTLAAQEVVELPAEDRLLDADFEEVYRVGALAGEDWETFGRIQEVVFHPSGNLYILDTQAARIVVVNEEGEFVRQFGGSGEGPGEFNPGTTSMMRIAVLRDGRLVAFDQGFKVFAPDGEFERAVRMPGRILTFMPQLDVDRLGRGVLGTRLVRAMRLDPATWEDDAKTEFRHILRLGLKGDEVTEDTVVYGWQPPGEANVHLPPLVAGALPGGGVAYTDSSAYAIKVTTPAGELMRILTRPFEPVPVPSRSVEAARKTVMGAFETSDSQVVIEVGDRTETMSNEVGQLVREQLRTARFYHELPVVSTLRTTWEGNVWVQRRSDRPFSDGPIDVLTPEGRYLGTFETDATAMPSAFGPDGLVAFVVRGELDVQMVVVKRLPPDMR